MNKFLVFRLEKWVKTNVTKESVSEDGFINSVYREPKYEDRKTPCFELIKELEDNGYGTEAESQAYKWAEKYSNKHNLRTLVIYGSIFGS